ncbi:MAG: hypothetical protein PHI79_04880 [Sulfurovaceae bacterium]|jgi:hypothetical protein|nr:hypothetical protein [Sulfurovaceae bacterium]MDD5360361.1 hypothetical protein [Sulfurovaceae bacterium]MDD5548918.1 hypothetical protein [Sulfurovaceae bacterium]
MKIDDILFELESNYIDEKDIKIIKNHINENGIKLEEIDSMLENMGYDAIFDDFEASSSYTGVQKISTKKHLSD